MNVGIRHWETIRPDNILFILRQPEVAQSQTVQFYIVRRNSIHQGVDEPRRASRLQSPEPLSRPDDPGLEPRPAPQGREPRRAGLTTRGPLGGSIRVGRDDLPAIAAAQPLPDEHVDRVLEELGAAVAEQRVDAPEVTAPGGDVLRELAPGRGRPVAMRRPICLRLLTHRAAEPPRAPPGPPRTRL